MNSLCSHHDRFTRATSDKRTERGPNPRYSFGLQTVYLLGPEPRAALDHATPLYTALGDTVKKAVSITSLSNLVRSIQIILKLQTSEQTPLMWKPGKTLFNKHKSPPFTMDLTQLQVQFVAEMVLMFSTVFKCFTQLLPALQIFKY